MNRSFSISFVVVLLAALPVQAQVKVMRRPIVYQFIHSPLAQNLVNFGLSQVLPGLPLGGPNPVVSNPASQGTIFVDSSVRSTLERTTANLNEAEKMMLALKENNKPLLDKKDPPKPADKKISNTVADPKDAIFQTHLKNGKDALKASNFKEAAEFFLEALKLNPEDDGANLGFLHASLAHNAQGFNQLTKEFNQLREDLKVDFIIKKITVDSLGKKDSKTVKVELNKETPVDLNLSVTAPVKGITGKGMIKANTQAGDLTITTMDAPEGDITITVSITSTARTKEASTQINTKIK